MKAFDFAPATTLHLLQKLDSAFSSLIHGRDVMTGDPLPGFESGRRITMTEKIRLQGLVERTRVQIVDTAKGKNADTGSSVDEYYSTADESNAEMGLEDSPTRQDLNLDVAKVYEKMLADLSDSLDLGLGQ